MLDPKRIYELFIDNGIRFFTGVPDSSLKSLTAYFAEKIPKERHIIAPNEGAAVALAAGHYLATNSQALVYMQNSGIGNAINPLLSLADENVYSIPMVMMIGWRGEPGVKDEPQHYKQGAVTLDMLKVMEIPFVIVSEHTKNAEEEIRGVIENARKKSIPHAIIVRPSLFEPYQGELGGKNDFPLSREEALHIVMKYLKDDIIISTTGKLSRELFEYRELHQLGHQNDFYTVGSMGHCSSIALARALEKPTKRIACLDGDGAILMHAGALSTIGTLAPKNFIHIVFNNGAHESVGGLPTVALKINLPDIARGFSYKTALRAATHKELIERLSQLEEDTGPVLLEIRVKMKSRKDLGRPTQSPSKNKEDFMDNLLSSQ